MAAPVISSRKNSETQGSICLENNANNITLTHSPEPSKVTSKAGTSETASSKSFAVLGLIFALALLSLAVVYFSFPKLEPNEKQHIKLPRNITDAQNLGNVLSLYKDKYYYNVLFGYFTAYIFLQSFAIPGSIFLSILSGFLFPFPLALFLVCLCSATGASFCYLLFYMVGRQLVWKYMTDRAKEWDSHVQRHKDHLLNYIIFLRITPFIPNWFINITSPVINVPIVPFFIGTFLGVAPPSFVAIRAGTTLHQLTSAQDALSLQSVLILAAFAAISLLPILSSNFPIRKCPFQSKKKNLGV